MGYRLILLLLVASALGACGKEIGDSCVLAIDCSPNGDRICDISSREGYCTIQGCDVSTCPDEAVCVRFFTGSFENKACDPAKSADACRTDPTSCCSLDELCAIGGQCVPHASEVRYCMRTCNSDGDCRDGYECRDVTRMIADGGEPVLGPGQVLDSAGDVIDTKKTSDSSPDGTVIGQVQKFCAVKPAAP